MLLDLVRDIDVRNSQLLSGDCSASVVEAVLVAARAAGATSVTGATPIGHALCGAAIIRSGGWLSLWTASEPGPVLIVDGITASYISSKMTQRRLGYLGVQASIHVVEIARMDSGNGTEASGATSSEAWGFGKDRIASHQLPESEFADAVGVA